MPFTEAPVGAVVPYMWYVHVGLASWVLGARDESASASSGAGTPPASSEAVENIVSFA